VPDGLDTARADEALPAPAPERDGRVAGSAPPPRETAPERSAGPDGAAPPEPGGWSFDDRVGVR
jgi:hypothetical protein